MNTVAGNEMLVLDAVKRYPNLDAFGLNPGLVKTNIRSNFLGKSRFFGLIEGLIGMLIPETTVYNKMSIP